MRPVDPGDLGPFLAVARHRSFRRAAVDLGTSASALSHAVRSLETRLGLRLFNRTTRSVALTEVGERLFKRVQPAFQDVALALEDLDAFRDTPTGVLRLNGSSIAVRMVLAPLVARFLATAPRMSSMNAASSSSSPSRRSMARRVPPSRLALNSRCGSSTEAPLAKVSFTAAL